MQTVDLVKIFGVAFSIIGILLVWKLAGISTRRAEPKELVKLGIVTLPLIAFYKLLAFFGLIVIPASAITLANYHVFEGTQTVNACSQCHVMRPMVNDMMDPESDTLAARHFKNHWIPKDQCYACHKDYGLNGTIKAKMDGYRHLMRYTTGHYEEPIVFRGTFNNENCLYCHQTTPAFRHVEEHFPVLDRLTRNELSCLNCHGKAHPSRAERSPGHANYENLIRETKK